MNCDLQQLEARLTPTSYLGDGVVQFAYGVQVRPYEDFHGTINILNTETATWLAAGQGGGPRVSVHDPVTGTRQRPDFWAQGFDPETYRGGIVFVVPDNLTPTYRPDTPVDLEAKGFVLYQANGEVPKWAWNNLRDEVKNVPQRVWTDIQISNQPLTLVWNTPITNAPALSYWKGRMTPDGRNYDALPAVGGPFVADLMKTSNADNRIESGSIIRHELAHVWLAATKQVNTEEAAEFLSRMWA
jgi:hypothetical protein